MSEAPSQDVVDEMWREIARPIRRPAFPCTSFFGHRFEPRYSYGGSRGELSVENAFTPEAFEIAARSMQSKTYHGDVCVRCGIVINDSPSKPA